MDSIEKAVDHRILDSIYSQNTDSELFTFTAFRSLAELDDRSRQILLQPKSLWCVFSTGLKDAELLAPLMFRPEERISLVKSGFISGDSGKSRKPGLSPFAIESGHADRKTDIDRLMAQEAGTYFAYLSGTVAGIFKVDLFSGNKTKQALPRK